MSFYKKLFKKRSSVQPCQVKLKLIMLFYYIIWRGDIIEIFMKFYEPYS